MYVLSRLFKPLNYLKIIHPQKSYYDYYIPAIIAIMATGLIYILPVPVRFFGDSGIVAAITGILQILTGFYIASLAAVATFKKEGMDQPLAGTPVEINIIVRGKKKRENLTRRRFLCLLFGYLALLSIFLYFLGVGSNLLVNNAKHLVPSSYHPIVRSGFVYFYLFLSANLITTTLHGLYYMVDRIHRSDPELVPDKERPVKLVNNQ